MSNTFRGILIYIQNTVKGWKFLSAIRYYIASYLRIGTNDVITNIFKVA